MRELLWQFVGWPRFFVLHVIWVDAVFGAMHIEHSRADMLRWYGIDVARNVFALLADLVVVFFVLGLQGPHDRDRIEPGVHRDCVPPAHW